MEKFLLYQYFITSISVLLLINFIINNILFKNIANYILPESFKKSLPLVSILIPARNEADNIKRCVRSLLKQDYPNTEILVLDDNSDDSTSHCTFGIVYNRSYADAKSRRTYRTSR